MSDEDEFLKLKKIWYEKLKQSGFKDIETPNGFIKEWPAQRLRRDYSPEEFKEKQDYFRMASYLYWEHSFDSGEEKKIWELHCEGLSLREIAFKLRTPKNKLHKDSVNKIILKLSKIVKSMVMHAEE